jgi:membrane protein implicated in regulation of membrane protease activity
METVLYILAGVSTAFFALRLILMFIGIDGADQADAMGVGDHIDDAVAAADFKVFTLLTGIVTLMVGSWSALLFLSLGWNEWVSLGAGYAVGFVASLGVGYAIFSLRKLEHDGTVREFKAEGLKGTVYVRIPEAGKGKGQVQVTVNGQMKTFDAVSDGPQIESFKPIVVMARIDESTLRVCPSE